MKKNYSTLLSRGYYPDRGLRIQRFVLCEGER